MYDLMGISADGIGEIQTALDTYKQGIDDPLSEISSKADYASAFKGSTIAENLERYLEAVINEIKKMTAYLDDFRASLDTVAANYASQAETEAAQIGSDTGNVTGVEVKTSTGVNGYNGTSGGSSSSSGTGGHVMSHAQGSDATGSAGGGPVPATSQSNDGSSTSTSSGSGGHVMYHEPGSDTTDSAGGGPVPATSQSNDGSSTSTGGSTTTSGNSTESNSSGDWNREYEVQTGDTLSEIARDEAPGTTYQEIADHNNISNPDLIYTGDVINLPDEN